MKFKLSIIFLFLFLVHSLYGNGTESFSIDILTYNQSANIKDGYAVASINGGNAPFKYFWDIASVDTLTNQANELIEGVTYNVTITDATNKSVSATFKIEAQTANEHINTIFYKTVDFTSSILLMDVFAALNLYDPVIYDEFNNPLLNPNGSKKKMSIPFIVVWLIFGAIFFTIKMRFINFRGFKHAIQLILGKYDNPKDEGQISHFQALSTALSATVGLGNIAGVAIAISLGGPGAVFWLIIAGILGMASKFMEATLGVKYRQIDKNGEVSGGPMYYLQYAFGKTGFGKKTGKVIAIFFAILTVGGSFGGGNMFQANQTFAQFKFMFPELSHYGVLAGCILAVLVGIVIIGGINSIAKVTSKIVPLMAIIYVGAALFIISLNLDKTLFVFNEIIDGAFNAPALKGGFVGVLIMGFRRAAFSNEAGVGSAAIAHSAVKTKEPVSEGIVALLEPFIDTVVICTITAMLLLFTGYYTPELTEGLQGTEITSKAFTSVISWFNIVLLISIFLFAYSTLISWSYYGQKAFNFLFGNYSMKMFGSTKVSTNIYNTIFLLFIIVGTSSGLGAVIDFSDMMILTMALPNITGMILLSPIVKKELTIYFQKLKNNKIIKYK
ncbi:MAG: alanine:cation symporter family protein [Bacteroidales bacterium]|nr:alanine:cation symporter family protein [Bacteroidales bacterium]